nr:MAG TPA: hypothetical protein [Caudoviricetes sp.]
MWGSPLHPHNISINNILTTIYLLFFIRNEDVPKGV